METGTSGNIKSVKLPYTSRSPKLTTTIHQVKSWPHLFQPLIDGQKKHDIRDMTERDYKVGDIMVLNEFDMATGKYTGRAAEAVITYITDRSTPCAMSSTVLERNYGILSLEIRDVFAKEWAA